jgi:hypothetical protein
LSQSQTISIYSQLRSQRLLYVLDFVFVEQLGIKYLLTDDPTSNAEVSYGLSDSKISIPMLDWLQDHKNIPIDNVEIVLLEIQKWIDSNHLMIPDIFGFIFWSLSRYEEYEDKIRDEHGRFSAHQSLAYRKNTLLLPIIDECISKLHTILKHQYPEFAFQSKKVIHRSTIDIDQMWAFAHKGYKVGLGALKARLMGSNVEFELRKKSFISAYDDPFFTFIDIDKWHVDAELNPTFFILSSDNKHVLDVNHPVDQTPMMAILQGLDHEDNIALHPSIHSHSNIDVLVNEKLKLEKVLGKKISKSRQHFLKLNLPITYRRLIDAGIAEDHSMGYADHIGYRAGTGHSFLWYDLENEKTTSLRIFPLIVMDVTLKKYMKESPESALSKCNAIISKADSLYSPFTLLWHNSSLSAIEDWTQWRIVYQRLLMSLSPKSKD